MNWRCTLLGWPLALAMLPISLAGGEPSVSAVAPVLNLDVALPLASGGEQELRVPLAARLTVVTFLGCQCPLAKLYAGRLQEMADRYGPEDVAFLGVNSNPQDSIASINDYARGHSLAFPIAKDHDGRAAMIFGATRTPEVFVLDSYGHVVYQGRIDDQFRPGVSQANPNREDLREAIDAYLEGRAIEVPRTVAAGCLIARRRQTDEESGISYCKQVSRILREHCVDCHRPGEIGPFSLLDYEQAVGWSDMMVETIEQKRMPPWHADPRVGHFVNARNLSRQERETIRQWVEAGTPFGDPRDLPPPQSFVSGWQFPGEPDVVIPMHREGFSVASSGTIDYQYFVVDPLFEKDQWVIAAEIVPGDRGVVHHALAFIRPPDGVRGSGAGLLTAYVPGQRIAMPPRGHARRIPAGSKIVFQMHYTPNGTPTVDRSRIGLVFADPAEVDHELVTLAGINHALEIPPFEQDVRIHGDSPTLPDEGKLLGLSPHMHLRGKSIRVTADSGGQATDILNVPNYDFNWQHSYILADPMPLDRIDSITFTATYDNSAANPSNPDPSDFVTWGDQSWEEMAIVFYEVAKPLPHGGTGSTRAVTDLSAPGTPISQSLQSPTASHKPATDVSSLSDGQRKLFDRYMADLDRDRDGSIRYDEVERAVQLRWPREIDVNGDRVIEPEELIQYILRKR